MPIVSDSAINRLADWVTKQVLKETCDILRETRVQKEVGFIPKIILLPKGQDVLGSDRIKVGTITYHVIDLFDPTSYEVVRRVLARRTSLPVST